jgi:hypothetical protein
MNEDVIKKTYATATMTYAMTLALKDTLLTSDELRQTYKKYLAQHLAEIATLSSATAEDIEKVLLAQTV